jgi:hypothetical protein
MNNNPATIGHRLLSLKEELIVNVLRYMSNLIDAVLCNIDGARVSA